MVYVVILQKRVKIEGLLTEKYVVKKFLKPQIVLRGTLRVSTDQKNDGFSQLFVTVPLP